MQTITNVLPTSSLRLRMWFSSLLSFKEFSSIVLSWQQHALTRVLPWESALTAPLVAVMFTINWVFTVLDVLADLVRHHFMSTQWDLFKVYHLRISRCKLKSKFMHHRCLVTVIIYIKYSYHPSFSSLRYKMTLHNLITTQYTLIHHSVRDPFPVYHWSSFPPITLRAGLL